MIKPNPDYISNLKTTYLEIPFTRDPKNYLEDSIWYKKCEEHDSEDLINNFVINSSQIADSIFVLNKKRFLYTIHPDTCLEKNHVCIKQYLEYGEQKISFKISPEESSMLIEELQHDPRVTYSKKNFANNLQFSFWLEEKLKSIRELPIKEKRCNSIHHNHNCGCLFKDLDFFIVSTLHGVSQYWHQGHSSSGGTMNRPLFGHFLFDTIFEENIDIPQYLKISGKIYLFQVRWMDRFLKDFSNTSKLIPILREYSFRFMRKEIEIHKINEKLKIVITKDYEKKEDKDIVKYFNLRDEDTFGQIQSFLHDYIKPGDYYYTFKDTSTDFEDPAILERRINFFKKHLEIQDQLL